MKQMNSCRIIDFSTASALHELHVAMKQPTEEAPQEPFAGFETLPGDILLYAPKPRFKMNILLCENLLTFALVRNLMKNKGQRRFFRTRVDGVAYASNGAFATSWGLLELERNLGDAQGLCYTPLGGAYRPQVTYLYWGDISRPSVMAILDIYRANTGRIIQPFAPAYRYMLDCAYGRKLPSAEEMPPNSFLVRLERYFTPMQQSTYRMVLAGQQRIPQGIVTERMLWKLSSVAC